MSRIRPIVDALCSPACAGRRAGTPEGNAARAVVRDALRDSGLDPFEQPVPRCGGANVLATIDGDDRRYVVIGAHFDHLGKASGDRVYWGADDNAAAVAVLVEVATAIAREREGRGVVIAAFDGEEPPFFATDAMGSQAFLFDPMVPREAIDFMVCMDLVGHRLGPEGFPDQVGSSLFALGAERSAGTRDIVRSLARTEPGLIVRTADAEIIPPLSDYEPFWRARIPFLFLTAGRSRVYHTPQDTPDRLDYAKVEATARWLTRFTRAIRTRPSPAAFEDEARDDLGTLDEIADLVGALRDVSPEAETALAYVSTLRAACDASGRLPEARRGEVAALVDRIESRLA
jgi:Zn-dependent M28 family amino/carboxypeptidase